MLNLPARSSVYLIGIGGVGMTPLALLLQQIGFSVLGSDIQPFRMADTLRQSGIRIFTTHRPEQIGESRLVIYSTAIPEQNPEYKEAQRVGIPCMNRLEAISSLVSGKKLLSITGSYGKSTTTTFTAFFAQEAGIDPSYLIGADLLSFLPAHWNQDQSDWFVLETDESRPEFLCFSPYSCVLTNVGTDHLTHYQHDIQVLKDHLVQYLSSIDPAGCLVMSYEAYQSLSRHLPSLHRRVITCGTDPSCDYRYEIQDIRCLGDHFETSFHLKAKGEFYRNLSIRMPSEKYVLDALLAFALITDCAKKKLDPRLFEALPILDRRSQLKRAWNRSYLLDDEGDSPDVIKEVLINVHTLFPGFRVIPFVQPHRFSRLQNLMEEYADVLVSLSDEIILLPVYPAGEEPIPGIDSFALAKTIAAKGFLGPLTVLNTHQEAADWIHTHQTGNNVFILLGPGDVWQVDHAL